MFKFHFLDVFTVLVVSFALKIHLLSDSCPNYFGLFHRLLETRQQAGTFPRIVESGCLYKYRMPQNLPTECDVLFFGDKTITTQREKMEKIPGMRHKAPTQGDGFISMLARVTFMRLVPLRR